MEEKLLCPKCGSKHLTSSSNGFSAGKALGGAILFGGIGLLAGGFGSKKVTITCLSCGKQFKPSEGASSLEDVKFKKGELIKRKKTNKKRGC